MRKKLGKAEDHYRDAIPNAGRNGEDPGSNGETESGSRSFGSVSIPAAHSAEKEHPGTSGQPSPNKRVIRRSPPAAYLNCPFQPNYEGKLIALVSGLVCLGIKPHIIPQDMRSRWRLNKIKSLANSCQFSLHDLSPVSGGRLNMAWELGIVMGTKNPVHKYFILVKEGRQLQKALSNLNGIDPLVHKGTEHGVLSALHRIFQRKEITPRLLRAVLGKVRWAYGKLRADGYGLIYEDPVCFDLVVQAAGLHLELLRRRLF